MKQPITLAANLVSVSLLALVASTSPDALGTDRGFYVSSGYTMVYAPDETLDVTTGNPTNTAESTAFLDYDLGFRAVSLAAGYTFENGLRAEFEGAYRRNELEVIEFSDARGTLNTGAKDSVDAFTGFVNLYYEFKPALAVRPYIGAGAGYASVGYKGNFSVLEQFERSESPLFDDRDGAFAWQVIAGASLTLTARTRLAAEYRYWQTSPLNFASDETAIQSSYRSSRHKLHMAGITLQYFPFEERATARSSNTNLEASQTPGRWYAAARLGAAAAEDSDVKDNSLDTNFDAFDLGPTGALAIGYEWRSKRGRALRAELEAQRFSNEADLVDFSFLAGEFRLRGDAVTTAIAVNLVAERTRRSGLSPYAGLGLGYAEVDYDVSLLEPRAGFPNQDFLKDKARSPMAQALLGVRVAVTPKLSASLGYRYWWAPLLKLRNPREERIETEHSAHIVQVGLHWRLR